MVPPFVENKYFCESGTQNDWAQYDCVCPKIKICCIINYFQLCIRFIVIIIRASVDALYMYRDGAGEISRDRLQRGRLTPQGTTS